VASDKWLKCASPHAFTLASLLLWPAHHSCGDILGAQPDGQAWASTALSPPHRLSSHCRPGACLGGQGFLLSIFQLKVYFMVCFFFHRTCPAGRRLLYIREMSTNPCHCCRRHMGAGLGSSPWAKA